MQEFIGKRSVSRPLFWLLFGVERDDPLTVNISGEEAPAVFCAREEAEMYLRFANGQGSRWRPKEIEDAELLSLLTKQWRGIKSIALDPLPENIDLGLPSNLYSTSLLSFITMLNFRLATDGQRVRTGLSTYDIGQVPDMDTDRR